MNDVIKLRSIAFISVATVVFGFFTVSISLRYGQLALPITYDDNGYFLDGIHRLSVWANGTIIDSFHEFRRNPPHSPYSSFVCAAAFALFGATNWAPAALNVGLVAIVLLAARRYLPLIPLHWFALLSFAVLTWPLMSFLVIESRPDIVCAALTAAGALGIVQNRWLTASQAHRFGMSAMFGLAVLAKPSISPITIATFFLCITAASLVDIIEDRPAQWKRFAISTNATAIAVVLLFCAAYSIPGWRGIIGYILFTTAGAHTDAYFVKDSLWEGLLYYITGLGGRTMMGAWLWPTLAIMSAGIVIAWSTLSRPRILAVAAVCAFLYLSVSVTGFKSIYLGVVVAWLFFLFFLQGVNKIHELASRRVFGVFVVFLALFGGLQYQSQWQKKSGQLAAVNDEDATWRRNLLDSVAADIASRDRGPIFFTATAQYLNATTLDLAVARIGSASTSIERPYADSLADYQSAWSNAKYVLAFSPDDPDVLAWLPSAKLAPVAWKALQESNEFKPLRTFENRSGGSILLYRRVQ